ncbi:hypothetical protein [Ilumatobacter nonamiensis]|uniref:hypothetical protein n=1 Tax=Ilumatobacter nonamiensis TaxID=467093 RepID=UPI00034706D8|nr:hypothetical protein [Ilumatobacter nonamiensis]
MDSADDSAPTGETPLHVDGHVDAGGSLTVAELIGLTTGIDNGRPSIALVDVLARIRLSSRADVVVVHGEPPCPVALPVQAILRQPSIRLIVEANPSDPGVVLLDAPEWTDFDKLPIVSRVTALTFAEFVRRR